MFSVITRFYAPIPQEEIKQAAEADFPAFLSDLKQ